MASDLAQKANEDFIRFDNYEGHSKILHAELRSVRKQKRYRRPRSAASNTRRAAKRQSLREDAKQAERAVNASINTIREDACSTLIVEDEQEQKKLAYWKARALSAEQQSRNLQRDLDAANAKIEQQKYSMGTAPGQLTLAHRPAIRS